MRQREEGACYVYAKYDGPVYILPRSEYLRILQEWMAGKAFWQGYGIYGAPLNIKLGDVIAISDNSPEAIALGRADQIADEKEDQIR